MNDPKTISDIFQSLGLTYDIHYDCIDDKLVKVV